MNNTQTVTVFLSNGEKDSHVCDSWQISSLGLEIAVGGRPIAFYKEGWSHVIAGVEK